MCLVVVRGAYAFYLFINKIKTLFISWFLILVRWFFVGYNCSVWSTRGHAKRILHRFCKGSSGWRPALHPPFSKAWGAGFILWSITSSWWPLGFSHSYLQGSVGKIGSRALCSWGKIHYRKFSCFLFCELYGVENITCSLKCFKQKLWTWFGCFTNQLNSILQAIRLFFSL